MHRIGLCSLENYRPINEMQRSRVLMSVRCRFCDALKFPNEPAGICCAGGKVILGRVSPLPPDLRNMFNDREFKRDSRKYNQAFAFTSLGANVDQNLASSRNGIYTFRICGQLYHLMGSLLPQDGIHRYQQIYFCDELAQINRRMEIFDDLNRYYVERITEIMRSNNPFVQFYEQMDIGRECSQYNVSFSSIGVDNRRYNAPTCNEVAAIILDTERDQRRDIVVRRNTGELQRISEIHPSYDPLSYPLLFPFGDQGWDPSMPHAVGTKKVTLMQYCSERLMVRSGVENPILLGSRLFQQYVVDQYAKIETCRLNYLRHNQNQLRADVYSSIEDALHSGEEQVGRRVILPSSFTGGPRHMNGLYQDSMALVRKFGKPDLFITFTCNPKWPDIQECLIAGQTSQDRPDIVVRVFREKMKELIKDLTNGVLGRCLAFCHTIEFQKRGLPHCHMLLFLEREDKPTTVEHIDRLISAEIPDIEAQPDLYARVKQHMIHGPCGTLNMNQPCMVNGYCSKKFPKPFQEATVLGEDSYPRYRRRDNRRCVLKRFRGREVRLDNRNVVPYNPYLLSKYDAHINVEVCSSVKAIKYIHKYIHKGSDRACIGLNGTDRDRGSVGLNQGVDEITEYQEGRYISPPEACWRIFGFKTNQMSHSVCRLPVHLPDQQVVTFQDDADLEGVLSSGAITKLTAFFQLCQNDDFARNLRYHEIPEHYTWQQASRSWRRRMRGGEKTIGRMYTIPLQSGELYYLRCLLVHVIGPTSFEHLLTVNGEVCETFKQACIELGLLEDDQEWHRTMEESALIASANQLRYLFCTILVFGCPSNVSALYDDFYTSMTEDFQGTPSYVFNQFVGRISNTLQSMGRSWSNFQGLPDPTSVDSQIPIGNHLIQQEQNYSEGNSLNPDHLNHEQAHAYNTVMSAVDGTIEDKFFFLDGPGGTGKTFLYETLASRLRSAGRIVLCVASSGIAATLLTGGRTAHSRFKIPLCVDSSSTCSISINSDLSELIRNTALIIWDEAPMIHRNAFEAVSRTFQDIMGCTDPWGGKVVLLGGDFRQIPPVIIHGTPGQIIHSSIKSSPLWEIIHPLHLTQNMRTNNIDYASYLLQIGSGSAMQSPEPDVDTLDELIDKVFPHVQNFSGDHVILATTNVRVDHINDLVSQRMVGESTEYFSADRVDLLDDGGAGDAQNYPTEFLNSLTPNGLPPHVIRLKVGAPIMLIRNLQPEMGLCNGTRLIVRSLQPNVIEAEVLHGAHRGYRTFIPRITLMDANPQMPFTLVRRQFPIRLCFAMTINKSQGQTLGKVGLDLSNPVFAHGQLYVALSRVRSRNDIFVLGRSSNVVYPQLVQQLH